MTITDEEIHELMKQLDMARLDCGMALLTNDEITTPQLRAQIEKARAKCAALFYFWSGGSK